MSHYYDENTKCTNCNDYFTIFDLSLIRNKETIQSHNVAFGGIYIESFESEWLCDECINKIKEQNELEVIDNRRSWR